MLSFFAKSKIIVSLNWGNRSSSRPSRVSYTPCRSQVNPGNTSVTMIPKLATHAAPLSVKGVLCVCLERQTGWR